MNLAEVFALLALILSLLSLIVEVVRLTVEVMEKIYQKKNDDNKKDRPPQSTKLAVNLFDRCGMES